MPRRNDLLALAMVAASWAVMAWYYPHLPPIVATHWGIDGKPNGWMPLPWGALWGPVMATSLYGLMFALPRMDPRVAGWEDAPTIYAKLRLVLAVFCLYITWLALEAASRPGFALFDRALVFGMGLMFLV